jgi:hypothetical protein
MFRNGIACDYPNFSNGHYRVNFHPSGQNTSRTSFFLQVMRTNLAPYCRDYV